MAFETTLDKLSGMDKTAYSKSIAKDSKKVAKAKGVLVIDDYKFKNGKAPVVLLTPKAKDAKEQFKAVKDSGHPTGKLARGTCKCVKGTDGKLSLEINFLEGGLAPQNVQTGCADIFQSLKVTAKITNIPGPEPDDKQDIDESNTEDSAEAPAKSAATDIDPTALSIAKQLETSALEIQNFIKTTADTVLKAVRAKQEVAFADYEQLGEYCKNIRNWIGMYNSADAKTQQQIGKANAVAIKESFMKVSQIKNAALKYCPDAMAKLQADTQEDTSSNNTTDTNQNTNNPPPNQNTTNNNQTPTPPADNTDNNTPPTNDNTVAPPPAVANNTPVAPARSISAAVGKGGMNKKADVITVQTLLNTFGYGLKVDGDCGAKSINAIIDFQKNKTNNPRPDGRIDPNGRTWAALNQNAAPPAPADNNTNPQPQPINLTRIGASVGKGGANKKEDVIVVQTLLQKAGFTVAIDGVCGAGTNSLIASFQKNKMKMRTPTSLIAPNDDTFKALQAGNVDDKLELRDKHDGKYDYTRIAGDLFAKGNADDHEIDETDVQQGQIGDCYFMSAVAAVAKTNPESLRKLIAPQPDGSYNVTLYSKAGKLVLTPTIVNVKPDFVTDASGNLIYAGKGDKELWVMLLEKAYAKLNGGYDDIGEGGFIEDGLEALTGTESNHYMLKSYSAAQIVELLTKALKDGKPITAASEGSGEVEFKTANNIVIYQGHAYSVESLNGSVIHLRNPWGYAHADLTVDEFKQYFNHFVI